MVRPPVPRFYRGELCRAGLYPRLRRAVRAKAGAVVRNPRVRERLRRFDQRDVRLHGRRRPRPCDGLSGVQRP